MLVIACYSKPSNNFFTDLNKPEHAHVDGPSKPPKPHHETVSQQPVSSPSSGTTTSKTSTVVYHNVRHDVAGPEFQPVLFDFASPLNISGPDRTFVSAYNGNGIMNVETRGILSDSERATIDALSGPFQAQSKAPIVCCAAVTPFIIIPCLWPVVVIAWLAACTLSVVVNVEPNREFQRVRNEHENNPVDTLTCCCAIVNFELKHKEKAPRNVAASSPPVTTQPAAAPATTQASAEQTSATSAAGDTGETGVALEEVSIQTTETTEPTKI
jgi:hypothetical protein